jgi:ParB/RepB/Spo0J family partition protein
VGLKRIHLDQIIANPDQPRKHFDEQALRELAGSIRVRGLKQPITVRPIGDGMHQIIMGERRWRAHCLLHDEGKLEEPTILAHVRKATDEEMAIDAIIENLARVDITPIEEARAFQRMLDHGYSVEQLAPQLQDRAIWRTAYAAGSVPRTAASRRYDLGSQRRASRPASNFCRSGSGVRRSAVAASRPSRPIR